MQLSVRRVSILEAREDLSVAYAVLQTCIAVSLDSE